MTEDIKQPLHEVLAELGIAKLLEGHEKVILEYGQRGLTPRQAIESFMALAAAKKRGNKAEILLKLARFPMPHTLESFDFERGTVDQAKIHELADCSWIEAGQNVLFRGSQGLGKTHLAVSLGRRATALGYSTIFLHANTFFEKVEMTDAEGTFRQYIRNLSRSKLLILDDLGHTELKSDLSSHFYTLLDDRYQKGLSTLITTNRKTTEWPESIGDAVTVKAAFDRFIGVAHLVRFTGMSYRLEQFSRRNGCPSVEEDNADE